MLIFVSDTLYSPVMVLNWVKIVRRTNATTISITINDQGLILYQNLVNVNDLTNDHEDCHKYN